MTRQIPINTARVLRVDFSAFDPIAGGAVVVTYVVGTITTASGVSTYQERPSEDEATQAVAQLAAGATVTAIWQAVLPIICQQEGLDPAAGDKIFPVPA